MNDSGPDISPSTGGTTMFRFRNLFCAVFALAMLLTVASVARADEMNGKVQSVDTDRMQVVVKVGNTNMTFNMDEDAQVLINNQTAQLQDLVAGDRVTIVHREEAGHRMAIEIRCERD